MVTRSVNEALVTRTVRKAGMNGNPKCQRGSYGTRSIAHKKSTVTPLLPH